MPYSLPTSSGPVHGSVVVPGSKSETNRALVLAALSAGRTTLRGALESRDSALMIGALRKLGVEIEVSDDIVSVQPPQHFSGATDIDCGLAGTVMRFVPPLALLAEDRCSFIGDPHASQRPLAELLAGLQQLGAEVTGQAVPCSVAPPQLVGNSVEIDASASSQFISGLLLVAPRLPQGLTIRHIGHRLPSLPHIAMTVQMLRSRGAQIETPDERTWIVAPGELAAGDFTIEPDLTNAAVFLAAAMVTGGAVTVPGWPQHSIQPGAMFLDIAQQMGAIVERAGDRVTVTGTGVVHGIDVDLTQASELTPVVAALAALADSPTRIRGVGHIRGHETDRLAALATELSAAGAVAEETDDGLVIAPGEVKAAALKAYADHRMVHAAALVALRAPGTTIDDMACTSKTMPRFEQDWMGLIQP